MQLVYFAKVFYIKPRGFYNSGGLLLKEVCENAEYSDRNLAEGIYNRNYDLN